eukprot:TRINITY_DN9014_c0_g1_i1.p1 TRINITY_DN9014_c0_g1~~TRINITY_DN9014_c0_g1_i1.p1  ORF type:complete len:1101 (+),score=166.05 TRINITY_DN9014_c0_g1_i1:44-3304(+)
MHENEISTEKYVEMWYRQTVKNAANEYLRPSGKLVEEFAMKYSGEEWGCPIRVGILAGMPVVSSEVVINNYKGSLSFVTDTNEFFSNIDAYTTNTEKTVLVIPALSQLDVSSIQSLLTNLDSHCQRVERHIGNTDASRTRNFAILVVTDKITAYIERLIHGRVLMNFSVDLMHSGLTSEGLHSAIGMSLFDPYLPLTPSPELLKSLKKPIAGKSLSLIDSWICAASIQANHQLCNQVMFTPVETDSSGTTKDYVPSRHQFLLNLFDLYSRQSDRLSFQKAFLKAWCSGCSKQYFDIDISELSSIGVDKMDIEKMKSLNGFSGNTVSSYSLFPAKSCTDTLTLLIEPPSRSCPKEEVLWSLRGDQSKTCYAVPEIVIIKRIQERRRINGDTEIPKKDIEAALRSLVDYKILRRGDLGGYTPEYTFEWVDPTTNEILSSRKLAEKKVLAAKEAATVTKQLLPASPKKPLRAVPGRLKVAPRNQTIQRQNQSRNRFRATAQAPNQMTMWGNARELESTTSSSQGSKMSSDATSGSSDDDTDSSDDEESSNESSEAEQATNSQQGGSQQGVKTPPLPNLDSPSIGPSASQPSRNSSKRPSPEGNIDHPFENPVTKRHAGSSEVQASRSLALSGSPFVLEVGIADNIREQPTVETDHSESDSDNDISMASDADFEDGAHKIRIVTGEPTGVLQEGLEIKRLNEDCIMAFLEAALKKMANTPALKHLQNKKLGNFLKDVKLPANASKISEIRKKEDGFPRWLSTWEEFHNSNNWCLSSMVLEKIQKNLASLYPNCRDIIDQSWYQTHNECQNAVLFTPEIPLPQLITSRTLTNGSKNMYEIGKDELDTLARIGKQIMRMLNQDSYDTMVYIKGRKRAMDGPGWRRYLGNTVGSSLIDDLRSRMEEELPFHQWGGKGCSLFVSLALELWRQNMHSRCQVAEQGHLLIDQAFALAVPNIDLSDPFSEEELDRQFNQYNTRAELESISNEDVRFSLKVHELSSLHEVDDSSVSRGSLATTSPQRVCSPQAASPSTRPLASLDCNMMENSPCSSSGACGGDRSPSGSIGSPHSVFSQCQAPDLVEPDYYSSFDELS